MSITPPSQAWAALPPSVRLLAARGSTGRDHLAALAGECLSQAGCLPPPQRASLAAMGRDALAAAWCAEPLSCDIGLLLSGLRGPELPPLPQALLPVLAALPHHWRAPAEDDPWRGLSAVEARELLPGLMLREPNNIFWKAQAWNRAWPLADWSLAEAALAQSHWPKALSPLRLQAQALLRLAQNRPDEALALLDALAGFFPGGAPNLRAECLLRLGRAEEAAILLAEAVLASPWRTGELLRLDDMLRGVDRQCSVVPGSTAIVLYTWNKARELDETLASLAASDTQGAGIWVLDNGSSDATPEVIERWRGVFGQRFSSLRLPVNVGAPAARNWLLSLAEVRSRDFIVFLDDDVTLPADWLGRLGAAAVLAPQAQVWGCRVVDEANALVAQSVDYTPLAPRPAHSPNLLMHLPSMHLHQPDFGQFSYLRSCVSVTGCCHMLRASAIDAVGGFDIRFSPSQYDDLERDLRVFLSGGEVVYQGHLCVRHKRRSGSVAERSPAEVACAGANLSKLQAKHGEEALARISRAGGELLERDLAERFLRLDAMTVGG